MNDNAAAEEGGRIPKNVRDALQNADNVTGAEVQPPTDLDGYLDEPRLRFGLWVGETEDEAELQTFEMNGDQIAEFADAMNRAVEHAAELDTGGD